MKIEDIDLVGYDEDNLYYVSESGSKITIPKRLRLPSADSDTIIETVTFKAVIN